MPTLTAVYDACVLYPAPLRSLLMHLAMTKVFAAHWTAAIHDEWMRNVLAKNPALSPARIGRTRALMDGHVPDCLVTGYEDLIPALSLPDPDDRHVLAAAIRSAATVIVTANLSDFPADALAPYNVEALHPDLFVRRLLDLEPEAVCWAAGRHRAEHANPPFTVDGYLALLERQGLPATVAGLRVFAHLI